jgi:hypothetical protein
MRIYPLSFLSEAKIYSKSLTTKGGLQKVETLLQKLTQNTRRSKLNETCIVFKKQSLKIRKPRFVLM